MKVVLLVIFVVCLLGALKVIQEMRSILKIEPFTETQVRTLQVLIIILSSSFTLGWFMRGWLT